MELPSPQQALSVLAAFVRDRLSEVGGVLGRSSWAARPDDVRQLASVIVTAAAPFAPTSYARARLLRQMHACGLLTERETSSAVGALESYDVAG